MNLFDQLVTKALENQPLLAPLRIVVEKELLHHDILRILSHSGLLTQLTFIGGTCLRTCYGSMRLSEDLDFTGGHNFTADKLNVLCNLLTTTLNSKYSLSVAVKSPVKDIKNVATWKIKVETRPESKHIAAQCIHLDICAIPSYDKRPMVLLNPYGVDMGTSGLIIQAQSREELYADKIVALALRPNRIQYRDLWDITWLHQQSIKPAFSLISRKLTDRCITWESFFKAYTERVHLLTNNAKMASEFQAEMRRFLPKEQLVQSSVEDQWHFIGYLLAELSRELKMHAV